MLNFGLKFTVAAISAIKSLSHRFRLHLFKFGNSFTSLRHRGSQCHRVSMQNSVNQQMTFLRQVVVLISQTNFGSLTFSNDLKIKTLLAEVDIVGYVLIKCIKF